jgi:hypothetical protein
MDPPALSRRFQVKKHASGQMQPYIRPLGEDIPCLRALMQSALPRLITTAASRALSLRRLGGSRSDLSCHPLDSTSHGAEELLDLSIKAKRCSNTCQRPVCSNSHACRFPFARGWLIVLVARQQRPDHPRMLVRHRHGRTVVAAALKELPHPLASSIRLTPNPADRRPRAMHQELAEIGITALADAEQALLPAGGMLARHQS